MTEKETYEAPELTEIGEVSELTREMGTSCSEMFSSGGVPAHSRFAKMCQGNSFS